MGAIGGGGTHCKDNEAFTPHWEESLSIHVIGDEEKVNEWLITNGNDEQQSDGSLWGVFVCKRVHQNVHHLGQFLARAPNIQHFRYEIVSTVIKCSDFAELKAFNPLP